MRNMIKMCFLEHFKEYNQILENIFQSIFWNATEHLKMFSFLKNIFILENIFRSIFWNATKHLKIFSFLKNIFTLKYFTLIKYFTLSQMQPKWTAGLQLLMPILYNLYRAVLLLFLAFPFNEDYFC